MVTPNNRGRQHHATKNDIEMARVSGKYESQKKFLDSLRVAMYAVPIGAMWFPAHELAGKDTNLNVVATVSVAVSGVAGATIAGMWRKMRAQSKELQRQRDRITQLELELKEATSS